MDHIEKWNIDWSNIPAWANWIAKDENGDVHCYENEPRSFGDRWTSSRPGISSIIDGTFNGDWRDSLTRVNVWDNDWFDECGQKINQSNTRFMEEDGNCYAVDGSFYKTPDGWDYSRVRLGTNLFIGRWQNSFDERYAKPKIRLTMDEITERLGCDIDDLEIVEIVGNIRKKTNDNSPE